MNNEKQSSLDKEFVPYKEVLVLKELGFDEPCLAYYKENELYQEAGVCYINADFEETMVWDEMLPNRNCAAPLYRQAFRWFREKYALLSFVEPANGYEDKSLFAFYICDDEQNIINDEHSYSKDGSLHFKTHEEAELTCLKKLIEIVKETNK